ncbi:MAG: inositol monophosphatase family protein [Candidatus Thorarchaeota archaeon]
MNQVADRELSTLKAIVVSGGLILNSYRGKVINQPKESDLPREQVQESSTAHTIVDDLVQDVALQILHSTFPDIAVNAEEDTPRVKLFSSDRTGFCFHLDPLDGTLAYTRNRDDFAIGAAFSDNLTFVSSAIYFPAQDRLYSAKRGFGTNVEDGLGNPLVFLSDSDPEPYFTQKRCERLLPIIEKMNLTKLDIMSAHQSMIALAEKRTKILMYRMASPHDFGIPQVILEEAGGICSDQYGNEITYSPKFNRIPWFFGFANVEVKKYFFELLDETDITLEE